jgi:hypothetical protein
LEQIVERFQTVSKNQKALFMHNKKKENFQKKCYMYKPKTDGTCNDQGGLSNNYKKFFGPNGYPM